MIHPHTRLAAVDPAIGLGVFATAPIPAGTVVVARDPLDSIISRQGFLGLPPQLRLAAERYMYHDGQGNLILSWDHARYMNHRCTPNTMITDYGVEIAVCDISAEEELTTEYGLLNVQESFPVLCGCEGCRGIVTPDDIRLYHRQWDNRIREALDRSGEVPQPLWEIIDPDWRGMITEYREGRAEYRSVLGLMWRF